MLRRKICRAVVVCVAATSVTLATVPATDTAHADSALARYTATAVNIGSPGRAVATTVDIVVNRWSTDAERDRLLSTLVEKGPEALLDELQDLPRVGYFRTPDSLAYDLRFARRNAGEDGGEQIILATDRPIGFWEARNRPRSIDYPFTVIEIRVGSGGEGEGKMSLATRITADRRKKTIVLEDYATQPVLLTSVRAESASR
jgi:hypothetical protein